MRTDSKSFNDDTHNPSPSRTLNTSGGSVELLLEIVEATERLVDGRLQRAILQSTSGTLAFRGSRSQILPEQAVVDMP